MDLYLLRHGLAVEFGVDGFTRDAERPLTDKGKTKLRKIAAAMKTLELEFALILSSPYVRARQTAEIIAEELHIRKRIELSDTLTPGGDQKKLIELLNRFTPEPEHVLLVGHEPHLSEFISLLVSGRRGFSVTMKKAGLCKLSLAALHFGRCASLEWLLTPGQMALIA